MGTLPSLMKLKSTVDKKEDEGTCESSSELVLVAKPYDLIWIPRS